MKVEGVWGLFLLLTFYGSAKTQDMDQSTASCPSTPGGEEEGESPELEEATSAETIYAAPHRIKQFYGMECKSEMNRKYRTFDGSCNHVFNLGAANTPFIRLLPPHYWDSVGAPRTHGKLGDPLTTPTDISRMVMVDQRKTLRQLTSFYMTWGQFVDHDIDLTPVSTTSDGAIKCCGPDGTYPCHKAHPQCFPIKLSEEDADVRFWGNCMNFVRSAPARDIYNRPVAPREQLNAITSFVDGSAIYGSSEKTQRELREKLENGTLGARLATSNDSLLPEDSTVASCIIEEQHVGQHHCFKAGDVRVNVHPGLIAMHTMWVRLHNHVVDGLEGLDNGWDEETLFQESRRIVVAILQNINYKEFLPIVVGDKMYELFGLAPKRKADERIGYSPYVDPRITNAFATAAFRFGHSNIPRHLCVGDVCHRFMDMYFRPAMIFTQFDDVVESMVRWDERDLAEDTDRHLVTDVTDHLFEPVNQTKGAPSHGLDLAALNIQRGRDHGLPPYNKFREFCGLEPIRDFLEFGSEELAQNLSLVYSSADDLDLFVGGLLETPEPGADVGPTFACIIAQQFHALKVGDRFWFESCRKPEGFTDDQLDAIRKIRGANVICKTTNIRKVPRDVFQDDGGKNRTCKGLNRKFLDFDLWKTAFSPL